MSTISGKALTQCGLSLATPEAFLRSYRLQRIAIDQVLFNHLTGEASEGRRDFDTKHLCRLSYSRGLQIRVRDRCGFWHPRGHDKWKGVVRFHVRPQ